MKTRRNGLLLGLSLTLFFFSPRPLPAAMITTCDEASLRTALAAGGTVTLACDGTITVTDTLVLATNVTLDASGHAVIISGNNAVRLFEVRPGVTLTMTNLTVASGGGVDAAAGVLNAGTLAAVRCAFANNTATPNFSTSSSSLGGAIWNQGRFEALDCTFTNNQAAGASEGGAIVNDGRAFINRCLFVNN